MLADSRAGLYLGWVFLMLSGLWAGGTIYGFLIMVAYDAFSDPHWAAEAPLYIPRAVFALLCVFALVPALIAGIPASKALGRCRTSLVATAIMVLPMELLFITAQFGRSFPAALMSRQHPSLFMWWGATMFAVVLFPPSCHALNFLITRMNSAPNAIGVWRPPGDNADVDDEPVSVIETN